MLPLVGVAVDQQAIWGAKYCVVICHLAKLCDRLRLLNFRFGIVFVPHRCVSIMLVKNQLLQRDHDYQNLYSVESVLIL